jgi:3-hydroxyacyl-CoA dehydrogenase
MEAVTKNRRKAAVPASQRSEHSPATLAAAAYSPARAVGARFHCD